MRLIVTIRGMTAQCVANEVFYEVKMDEVGGFTSLRVDGRVVAEIYGESNMTHLELTRHGAYLFRLPITEKIESFKIVSD